jgi:hypothetical protein
MTSSLKEQINQIIRLAGYTVDPRGVPREDNKPVFDWIDDYGKKWSLDASFGDEIYLKIGYRWRFHWRKNDSTVEANAGFSSVTFEGISNFAKFVQIYVDDFQKKPRHWDSVRVIVPKALQEYKVSETDDDVFNAIYLSLKQALKKSGLEKVKRETPVRSLIKWFTNNQWVTLGIYLAKDQTQGHEKVIHVAMWRRLEEVDLPSASLEITVTTGQGQIHASYLSSEQNHFPCMKNLNYTTVEEVGDYIEQQTQKFFEKPETDFLLDPSQNCMQCLSAEAQFRCTECKFARYCSVQCAAQHADAHARFCQWE